MGARFQCTCTVDRQVQDASHHGTVVIPATAADSAEHITVTISNFGNLAVVTLGNPASYNEEEEHELFHATDRLRAGEELEALGCTVISEYLLWTRYDGVSDLVSCYPPEHPPNVVDPLFRLPVTPPAVSSAEAFREFQHPSPPLHFAPGAHQAVLGAWERLDSQLVVSALGGVRSGSTVVAFVMTASSAGVPRHCVSSSPASRGRRSALPKL
ncbi:hypothetical protein ACWIGY_37040 [Streptomyces anulatus]